VFSGIVGVAMTAFDISILVTVTTIATAGTISGSGSATTIAIHVQIVTAIIVISCNSVTQSVSSLPIPSLIPNSSTYAQITLIDAAR
jgi:hypothetical protein